MIRINLLTYCWQSYRPDHASYQRLYWAYVHYLWRGGRMVDVMTAIIWYGVCFAAAIGGIFLFSSPMVPELAYVYIIASLLPIVLLRYLLARNYGDLRLVVFSFWSSLKDVISCRDLSWKTVWSDVLSTIGTIIRVRGER